MHQIPLTIQEGYPKIFGTDKKASKNLHFSGLNLISLKKKNSVNDAFDDVFGSFETENARVIKSIVINFAEFISQGTPN